MSLLSGLLLSGIVLLSPALASAEVVFQLVDASPDQFGHTFASINEHGQVAFRRNQGSSNASILAWDPATQSSTLIVSGSRLSARPTINNLGQVAYLNGVTSSTTQVEVWSPGSPTQVYFSGNDVPISGQPVINDSGLVAYARLINNQFRIYTKASPTAIPSLVGEASSPLAVDINNSGDVALFRNQEVFLNGESLTKDTGLRPNSNPILRDDGLVVFSGALPGDFSDIFGVRAGEGPQVLASAEDFGQLSSAGRSINNHGSLAFIGSVDGISSLIFNGNPLLSVGDQLDGEEVTALSMGMQALNDSDQIAFKVEFNGTSSAIYVATVVPEPAMWMPLAMLGMFGVWRRYRIPVHSRRSACRSPENR